MMRKSVKIRNWTERTRPGRRREGTSFAPFAGGITSWHRVRPPVDAMASTDPKPREWGEPLIPFARIDAGYQDVDSDVEGSDYRIEGGYGPLAVHFNQTHFPEKTTDD